MHSTVERLSAAFKDKEVTSLQPMHQQTHTPVNRSSAPLRDKEYSGVTPLQLIRLQSHTPVNRSDATPEDEGRSDVTPLQLIQLIYSHTYTPVNNNIRVLLGSRKRNKAAWQGHVTLRVVKYLSQHPYIYAECVSRLSLNLTAERIEGRFMGLVIIRNSRVSI